MTEKKITWTDQQLRAIAERARDVLVTASAGTGKTAVLSGRAVEIIADKSLCPDIWGILVVTFTDAAAEQMRQRIAEQLADMYHRTKDEHLRRQLTLLQGADISTIHSFCKKLITEHFYELELDPTFGIIDGDEQKLLKNEVLEQTIDWAWRQDDLAPELTELLQGRDVRPSGGFLDTIIDISDFLQDIVCRDRWYEKALAFCDNTAASEDIADKQKQIVKHRLDEIITRLQQLQSIADKHGADQAWLDKYKITHLEPFSAIVETFTQKGWKTCAQAINEFNKPRTHTPKEIEKGTKDLLSKEIKKAVDILDEIKQLAVLNPDYFAGINSSANKQTKVLIELVKKFDQLYTRTKRLLNRLDFADLERYVLKLLSKEQNLSQDELQPSKIALDLRRKYRFVFVDEYQDINPVQKAIIDLISNGGNTFVVGDVKQSIYAFRGAEPNIFINGLKAASLEPLTETQSRRVDLNRNFRSAKGILDFVNLVFTRLMSADFGGIDYDQAAMLQCASEEELSRPVTPTADYRVELHLLDDEIEQDDQQDDSDSSSEFDEPATDIVTARQRQAAAIARRIRQMVAADTSSAQFEIYDKHLAARRPVEYRDIVILMRSPSQRANTYVEVLQLAGIPVSCKESSGYFEATEISDCLCLLKVLDNPQRDIELAALLRGPVFKFNDTEFAQIRLFSAEHNRNYYDCVKAYSQQGPDKKLKLKLQQTLDDIERWRQRARAKSIADLLWQIYREADLLAFYSALPNGQTRQANLLKLHERAIQFEGFAAGGTLSRFVTFIEQLQDSGAQWAGVEPEGSVANAVRIMSVHKSKGLEFPVVFIAELDGEFNLTDTKKDILLGLDIPIGLDVVDTNANVKLRTTAFQLLAKEKLETNLAEEMRIMYVAMTRARERLVITASEKRKKCEAILRKGFEFGDSTVAAWQLTRSRNLLEWLLYSLSNQKSLHNTFETGLDAKADDDFNFKLYETDELKSLSEYIENLRNTKKPRKTKIKKTGESGLLENVKKSLQWNYAYTPATNLPAKRSVTQLTHYNDEFVQIDYSRSLERRPRIVLGEEFKKEQFVDGWAVGTVAHLIISSLDLASDINSGTVRWVADNLIADGRITPDVARSVNIESIAKFFQSALGRLALDPANKVRREWPFTFALPVSQLDEIEATGATDDSIVVQGIVDMLIETSEGLVIIDFKTDNITKAEVPDRANLYEKQLQLYTKAASAILRKPVSDAWLYFLSLATAVEVKL